VRERGKRWVDIASAVFWLVAVSWVVPVDAPARQELTRVSVEISQTMARAHADSSRRAAEDARYWADSAHRAARRASFYNLGTLVLLIIAFVVARFT
jgi:hypothetical protein